MSDTDNMPQPTRFGVMVRSQREKLELSRPELADLAGLSEPRIRHIEQGWQQVDDRYEPTYPRRDTVRRIAAALGLPLEEALIAAGFEPKESDTEPLPDVRQNRRVFRLWNRLDADDQQLSYSFMARLAGSHARNDEPDLLAS